MTEGKWGLVYCPRGGWHADKRWDRLQKILQRQQVDYECLRSENKKCVERLVRKLISGGYHNIIIIGGDSALNDAVNCLMSLSPEEREKISLGVIPNGLMNDFAHFWGITDSDDERTVKWLQQHRTRKIDLGLMRYTNKKGEKCRRYFINCVNVGLIAAIMNIRSKTRHLFGARSVSFFISFFLMIFQHMDYEMDIRINADTIKRRVMAFCVGNAPGYGQTPNAVPYNGLLDASVVFAPKTKQFFEGIYLFLKGKFLNSRSLIPYRTQEVEVNSISDALVCIDGRLMHTPAGPFTISVEQEVINFLIP